MGTGRSDTSQYPRGKERKLDFPSSGERKGTSLNRRRVIDCIRCVGGVAGTAGPGVQTGGGVTKAEPSRSLLESSAAEGDSPVGERTGPPQAVSQVAPDS